MTSPLDPKSETAAYDGTIRQDQLSRPANGLTAEIIRRFRIPAGDLARYLDTSLVSVVRGERGDTTPGPHRQAKLVDALQRLEHGLSLDIDRALRTFVFASRGARRGLEELPLFRKTMHIDRPLEPRGPIISMLCTGSLWGDGAEALSAFLSDRSEPAPTIASPAAEDVSAGRNTYTDDAHTYHAKVPSPRNC
jgi:hypothetical protein